jgi:hypothetical protein
MRITIQLLFICGIISCSGQQNINVNYGRKSTYKLDYVQNKVVSLTHGLTNSFYRVPVQYLEYNNERFILYFDVFKDNIHIINYETSKSRSINLRFPHTNLIERFYAISLDSIFLLEYHASSIIYLVDADGELLNKFPLGKNQGSIISCEQEPMWSNNKLMLPGYTASEKPIYPVCYIYDTKTEQYYPDKIIDYPEFYYKENYWMQNYQEPYTHVRDNTIIYSFPASHKVYLYDVEKQKIKEYNAGSSLIKELHPFPQKISPAADVDYLKYWFESPAYYKVIHDPYRKMYYRIVGMPSDKFNIKDQTTYRKKTAVIIFDEEFNFLGETLFDEQHEIVRAFVNKDGLHFRYNFEKENEMIYKIYRPTMIK